MKCDFGLKAVNLSSKKVPRSCDINATNLMIKRKENEINQAVFTKNDKE